MAIVLDGNNLTTSGLLNSMTAKSATGTSIDFTAIPSGVKRITLMFNAISTNGTSAPQIQIGSGSVATTGYGCTNTVTINGSVAGANFTSGFGIGVNTSNWAATSVVQGLVTLSLLSGNIWVCSGSLGSSAGVAMYNTAGSVTLSGILDRVRITTVNGTDIFDAGTINILYE